MKQKAKLLLDYDGFVAKSYYASMSKDNSDKDSPDIILQSLTNSAIEKAEEFFGTSEIDVYKILSGHTFKKDLFPSYKSNRKSDEGLGEFRDWVKTNVDVVIAENLEADDLICLINSEGDCLVISDDKDLRYYNPIIGRVNPEEEIITQDWLVMVDNQYVQMITGDTIDGIKGIPNRGKVWAQKYLDKTGYSLESVIKAYKENNVSSDECLKNIVEVIPVSIDYIDEEYKEYLDIRLKASKEDVIYSSSMKLIEGFIRFLSKKIKEIYYDTIQNS